MTLDATASRPLVLLARSDSVDRAVLEADLLRLGYDVVAAGDADGAMERVVSERVDVIVTDLELPGGGGFSVCRKARTGGRGVPCVALSPRADDAEVRRLGAEVGVEDFLAPPVSVSQLHAAIELALSRGRRSLAPGADGVIRGDLTAWSLADLVRYVESRRWTADMTLSRDGDQGVLHFRDGSVTFAEQASLHGERAFDRMLYWRAGSFALTVESADGASGGATRPPRNIHRGSRDVLMDGLSAMIERDQLLQALPRGTEPHRIDAAAARMRGMEAATVERLINALKGQRPLVLSLEVAGCDDLRSVKLVADLIGAGALVPLATATTVPDGAALPASALDDAVPADVLADGAVLRRGNTVRRKLDLRQDEEQPAGGATVLPEDVGRRRHRQKIVLTWATIGILLATFAIVWYVTRRPTEGVAVHVLDEPSEIAE